MAGGEDGRERRARVGAAGSRPRWRTGGAGVVERVRRAVPALVSLAGVVALWQAAVLVFDVPTILLPPPAAVGAALAATAPTLFGDAGVTAATAALGLAGGCLVGGVLAFVMTHSRRATQTVLPYVIALRIAPLVAIAPLVFLWFGRGVGPRALLVATLTLFPMTVATLDGLRSTPQEYLALMRSVAAPPTAVFLHVRVPAAAPSVLAGLKLAATLAVVGAVVAEFVTLRAGLGYRVFVTADRLRTAETFAALAVLAVVGILFYLVPAALARAAGIRRP